MSKKSREYMKSYFEKVKSGKRFRQPALVDIEPYVWSFESILILTFRVAPLPPWSWDNLLLILRDHLKRLTNKWSEFRSRDPSRPIRGQCSGHVVSQSEASITFLAISLALTTFSILEVGMASGAVLDCAGADSGGIQDLSMAESTTWSYGDAIIIIILTMKAKLRC